MTQQTITPKHPQFEFTLDVPPNWQRVPLPEEDADFSDPSKFLPLGMLMTSYAPILFTLGVRPPAEGQDIPQYLKHNTESQGARVQSAGKFAIGEGEVDSVLAEMDSEAGPMQARIVMFRIDRVLFMASVMSPQPLWAGMKDTLEHMLASLKFTRAHGDPGTPPRDGGSSAPAEQQHTYAEFALADDTATLDPEHELNANLRNNGVGLVPNVLHVDQANKFAVVGCGSVTAAIPLPLGWHVIDDGKRALFFDRGDGVQINFALRATQDMSEDQIFAAIVQDITSTYTTAEHAVLEFGGSGGVRILAFRNMQDNGQTLQQAHLLRPSQHGPHLNIHVRVTAPDADMPRAMNLAELMIRDMQLPK
jgi:hypothetical protein